MSVTTADEMPIGEALALLIPRRPWAPIVIRDEDVKPKPVKRTRQRGLTLPGITKQAEKAGLVVLRVEYYPNGRISSVTTGKPGDAVLIGANDDDTIDRSDWH